MTPFVSPLRYPGGKLKVVDYVKQLMEVNDLMGGTYIEPYAGGASVALEKTTGELQDGMHSACAFLNTEGGLLIFGVAPTSLKILGQQVTDSTQREIAHALAGLYPAVEVKPEYIDVPGRNGDQLIVMHFSGWRWGQMPYTYRGCPYYKNESTTQVMLQEMYEERLRAAKPEKFAWERQEAEGVALADLDEKRIRGAVRLGVERGRMPFAIGSWRSII